MNPHKRLRIRAEQVENAVIKHLGSLLSNNGILEEAVSKVFGSEKTVLNKIDHEIAQKVKESKQCERVLEVISKQGRIKILDNPELMDEILLEGIKIKKESEAQLKKLQLEIDSLNQKKEELARFSSKNDICSHIQRTLKALKKSSSLHKKQLIQMMVPKLIMDEKNDQLCFFINPFLEKSFKNTELSLAETKPVLELNSKKFGQQKMAATSKTQTDTVWDLSQSKKKVRVTEDWRGARALCKPFFLHVKLLGITRFYVTPLFKNKFFLHQKYVVEGLSARQIAREIFSSKMAVLDALARFGIPIREPHHHHGNPSQPRFGKRFRKNFLVDDKVEQRVILVVQELRTQGFSLRKIAKILNDMRVTTKCDAKSWHPEMIRRIIDIIDSTDG